MPTSSGEHIDRRRWAAALALVLTVVCGLVSRSGAAWIPAGVADHFGDALWSVALYCTLAFILPRASVGLLFVAALAGSWIVESSQLIHTPTIDQWRSYRAVRLLIGTTFVWSDLPRYLAGCICAAAIDGLARRRGAAQRVP